MTFYHYENWSMTVIHYYHVLFIILINRLLLVLHHYYFIHIVNGISIHILKFMNQSVKNRTGKKRKMLKRKFKFYTSEE